MNATVIAVQDKVNELLAVLDKDIQHIQDSLSWLNELRSLVIKRDDAALSKLLQSIRAQSDSYVSNEQQRQSLRKDLANALGCRVDPVREPRLEDSGLQEKSSNGVEQVTLSRLASILPEEKKAQVIDIKTKLRALVEQLKKEHLSTSLLLSDCARFNNLLLRAVFDLGKTGTVYYSPNGVAKRPALGRNSAFVSLRL